MLVVDAANVVGSRPDGWWRDRAGAAARLHAGIAEAVHAGVIEGPVVMVLEGAARRGVPECPGTAATTRGGQAAVTVVHAPGAGDDTIVEVVRAAGGEATVVTADRGLRDRVTTHGATVVGPRWLLDRMP